jgi:transposase
MLSRIAAAYRGEGKTDAKDSRIIADQARMRHDLFPVRAKPEQVVALTALLAHRRETVGDRKRLIMRIRDHLTSIFPALERALDYGTRTAAFVVSEYQTPGKIHEAGRDEIVDHIRACVPSLAKSRLAKFADRVIAAADAQTLRLPGEERIARIVAQLAGELIRIDGQLKALDSEIVELFHELPQAGIIESLPGMGPILGAEFVTATGGDLSASLLRTTWPPTRAWRRSRMTPAGAPASTPDPRDTAGPCVGPSTSAPWPA